MTYPEILTSLSGEKITNIADWENIRRDELLNLFATYVYGIRVEEKPKDLSFHINSTDTDFKGLGITYKKIDIKFYGYSFPVKVFTPSNIKKPVPAFVYIMHEYQSDMFDLETEPNASVVPVINIVDRGYAVAVMPTVNVALDWEHHDEHKSGVYSVLQPDPAKRSDASWSTISAWAWGASRVLDYLESDMDINSSNVGVIGHSRSGKAALWCGATDTRFAYVVSNNSGCMGSAMIRGKIGERIKDINITDWFCENFKKYNEREEMLPIDQHMLLALIAPRLLYVASASLDDWSDPESELRSCKLAGRVYEMYGKNGLIMDEKPRYNKAYHAGTIAYHVREGDHEICEFDWDRFIDFADKKLDLI